MLLALHAALVSEPGGVFQRMLAAGALRPVPAVAAVLRRRARARRCVSVRACCSRSPPRHPLVPRRLDDRHVAAAAAGDPRRARLHRAGRARATASTSWPSPTWSPCCCCGRCPALLLGAHELPEHRRRASRAGCCPSCWRCSRCCRSARRTTPARCSTSSTRCWSSSWAWCWCWAPSSLMRFTDEDYVESVLLTVTRLRRSRSSCSRCCGTRCGASAGLRTYFSTYLMSVGMPFELWMRRIAELAETEPDPRRFLEQALREIAALPWMRGGHWNSPDGEGRFGAGERARDALPPPRASSSCSTPRSRCRPRSSCTCACSRRWWASSTRASGARTRSRQHAYLQAVHETGARLTHDVKNLLQSLYALTSMAPKEPAEGYAGAAAAPAAAAHRSACRRRSRSCARPRSRRSDLPVPAARLVAEHRARAWPAATWRSRRRSRRTREMPSAPLRQLRRERDRQRARQARARARRSASR